jgi:hypothetical protein
MSSSFLKPDAITAEALRILHNNCVFIKNIDKQHDKETTFGGQKRGAALRVRLPNKYTVRETWALNAQDQDEQSETLTVGTIRGVDMNFTEADLALEIDEFSKRFITPAAKILASKIDYYCIDQAYKATYNSVGTPGTTPSTARVYLESGQKMNEESAPVDDRLMLINPKAQAYTVDGLKALFNASSAISEQYRKGAMGRGVLGFDWYMSQNIPNHTCGSRSGSILVDEPAGTNLTNGSSTIHVDALGGATQTFKQGDVFTIADVYAVNPETKESTGALRQFVVTADATASSSEVDLSISPAFYNSGALQNVDALPVDGAAVTVVGTASTQYPQNLAYHPEAYTFASANLEMPKDVSFKSQLAVDGINIRILRQYDINNSQHPCRMDVFFGFLAQRPELGCRVWG